MPAKKKSQPSRAPSSRRAAPLPEALLARALREQSEGVLIGRLPANASGCVIVFVNARFSAITGYAEAEMVGRGHGLLHPDPEEIARFRQWAAKAAPGSDYVGEGDLVRKNGESFYAAWGFSVMRGAAGRRYVVATYRDTTEKRHLMEALMHAQRLDAVGRLAGGVAHDFNNLISVINGYCQLLATREGVSGEVLRDVEEIHKAGQKAAGLTRQLLTFGRRQPMSLRLLSLNQLVRDNADILRRLLDGTGELVLELSAEPIWVRSDSDQLQQVLLNLALNARDALRDHGRVTIRTGMRQVDSRNSAQAGGVPPGQYALLTVVDNGTGMDAYTQDHLFEPFYTTKEPGKGSGLGLATVYGVMQQSGGYIRVRSTLLVGTTFDLYLPAVAGEEVPAAATVETPVGLGSAAAPVAAPVRSGSASPFSPRVVLLIESDRMVSKMAAGMLAADGYRVVAAESPARALALLRREPTEVHVLISACGRQVECAKLITRLRRQATPLSVLCTLHCGAECPAGGETGCVQRILPKPYAMSELLQAVRQLLQAGTVSKS